MREPMDLLSKNYSCDQQPLYNRSRVRSMVYDLLRYYDLPPTKYLLRLAICLTFTYRTPRLYEHWHTQYYNSRVEVLGTGVGWSGRAGEGDLHDGLECEGLQSIGGCVAKEQARKELRRERTGTQLHQPCRSDTLSHTCRRIGRRKYFGVLGNGLRAGEGVYLVVGN